MPPVNPPETVHSNSPVRVIPSDVEQGPLEPGPALCLSGGGYRAMLYHLGAILRLNHAGVLPKFKRISSVSGGSITAGVLGHRWRNLRFDGKGVAGNITEQVVAPIRGLASRTIDASSIISGALLPGTIAEKLTGAYRRFLFGDATLQSLPSDGEGPRFVINATSVQSGALWRFSKPYMADYRVGKIPASKFTVDLAVAVAASSAFPPVLSPMEIDLDPSHFEPGSGLDLQRDPYTSTAVLTDGGVYDNLGLETVWKRYSTVLVSDAGGKMEAQADPKRDWARHTVRVLFVIDNQVRSLRTRQAIDAFADPAEPHSGAYWGIDMPIDRYKLDTALPASEDHVRELAQTPTRLKSMDARLQERLINWGFVSCDAAIRKYFDPKIQRPESLPYPEMGI